jgi:pyrimidine-nucleoside phosphorylase
MRAVDIIVRKRNGDCLGRDDVQFFVEGVTDGTIPDYQTAALLMAVLCRGLSAEETSWLTDAMVRSGVRADLSDIPGRKVDKHSTGGVGDKTSLIVAPLVAACDVPVPMMSGRGLGHTGGTLDKLEAIPGFRVSLTLADMKAALRAVGCALIGQTDQIAPADKKLYALRDVTGTVESIPLISASIMSKKIAEGIDGLVLDVKTGSGAFMKTEADARRLAEMLIAIGRAAGLRTEALITAMDAPLGRAVGNAVEVVEVLKGRGPADLIDVSMALAVRMLVLAGAADDPAAAEQRLRATIASGGGLERLARIIEHQGGDPGVVEDYGRLPSAPYRHLLRAPRDGFLVHLDAEQVGLASVALGAGRARLDDVVDPAVGVMVLAKPGAALAEGDPILELLYRSTGRLDAALARAHCAIRIGDEPQAPRPAILAHVS